MTNANALRVSAISDNEIAMTRTFDAPRNLVFDAWTKPELLQQWLGVRGGWSFAVCEVDLRVGGKYRFVWRKPGQPDLGMGGEYREIVVPARLVYTEAFDQSWYSGDAINTVVFDEDDGRTTVTGTTRYQSKEVCDAVLASPMEKGVAESYDKLEELLAAL